MKKFRYSDPSKFSFFKRIRPYVLLIVGWNIIGISIWKFAAKRAERRDPAWENRSDGEKIAIITGSMPRDIKKYKYTIFGPSDNENRSQDT